MNDFTYEVISVRQRDVRDKNDGSVRTMYQVFIADETGNVGSLWSTTPHAKGEVVELKIVINRDGAFVAKLRD